MLRSAFWAAAGVIAYTYFGYPLIACFRARVFRRPYRSADWEPTMTVIVAAHNEQRDIARKLANLAEADYPVERLQILVASDGSTDETVAQARSRDDLPLTVLDLPRSGKAGTLNAAVRHATGTVLVFTDANSMFGKQALRALVRPLADPSVGGVAGDQRYDPPDIGDAAAGERQYWSIDRQLKRWESEAGSAIAATGAIYAIRRALYRPVPSGVNDDFFLSAGVVAAGQRLIFAADAVASEPVAADLRREFKRKVRVIGRALRTEIALRELLNPARFGFYSVQLASHKILRHLMFIPLVVLAAVSPALARRGPVYRTATLAQSVCYGLAAFGVLSRDGQTRAARLASVPAYFCVANAAAAVAAWNVARGRRIDAWQTAESRAGTLGAAPREEDRLPSGRRPSDG